MACTGDYIRHVPDTEGQRLELSEDRYGYVVLVDIICPNFTSPSPMELL